MLRFLRQYNKIFLGVFGVLLLLAWAIGGSLSQISNYAAREGTAWATIGPDNRKVTVGELQKAHAELNVVEDLKKFAGQSIVPIAGVDASPAQWYLATKEAAEAGLVGGEQDATQFLELMATALKPLLEAEGLQSSPDAAAAIIGSKSGANSIQVRQTIAKLNGLRRLRDVVASMSQHSDVRVRAGANRLLSGAAADLVVLDARTLVVPAVSPPTEEALASQLASYGADLPGKGKRGFGYRLPNRVRFEWLQIREAQVRAAVTAGPGLDSLSLKKRFAENPAKFGAGIDIPDPLAVFSQYEDTVRKDVIDELVTERMREIAKFAMDQFSASQRGLKRDGTGLYVLPADWASIRPSFETVAAEIAQQFKIEPPTFGSTGTILRPVDDVKSMPGIGSASTTQFGDKAMTLPNLLAMLKEFTTDTQTPLCQAGITLPPLTATNKDIFLVRVIDAIPSAAPTSVDEVRAALVKDVSAVERYDALVASTGEIESRADADGLFALASSYGTTVQAAPNIREANPQFLSFGAKAAMSIPGIGADEAVAREIVQRAAAIAAQAPPGTPVSALPVADRTFVLPLPDRLMLAVVRVSDVLPLTQEEFEPLVTNARVLPLLSDDGTGAALQQAFSLESLMARHNFKPVRGENGEENEAGTDQGTNDSSGTPKSASAG